MRVTHSLIRSFVHPWNLRLLYPPSHSAVYHKFYSFTHNAIVKWCKCHSLCLLISPIMDGNIKFYITINFVCAARHMGNENDDSLNQFRTVFLKDIYEFIKFSLQTVSIKNYFHLKAREKEFYSLMLCWVMAMTDRSTADMLFNELKLMNFSLLIFPRRYWNTSSIARISTSPARQWTRCRRSIDSWCKLCPQCHMPACK